MLVLKLWRSEEICYKHTKKRRKYRSAEQGLHPSSEGSKKLVSYSRTQKVCD